MTTESGVTYELSTKEFARLNQSEAQTVRLNLCRHGSYFGVKPLKLANNRLAWPRIQVVKGGAK